MKVSHKVSLSVLLLFLTFYVPAQNIGGVINDYRAVTAVDNALDRITVTDASPFNVGDEVLIIQMKGASVVETDDATFGNINGIGNAGNFEKAQVSSKSVNTLFFECGLINDYDASGSVQVVTIPKFTGTTTVTSILTGDPWDGSVGGIVIFEAETLVLEAPIDATGIGFAEGRNNSDDVQNCEVDPSSQPVYRSMGATKTGGEKGEGIGVSNFMWSIGKLTNGGGGGGLHNGSGGGGSNWGIGGSGALGFADCAPYTFPQLTKGIAGISLSPYISSGTYGRIFMGGGGGAGHGNNFNESTNKYNYGGPGGGIIIIKADLVETNYNGQDCNFRGNTWQTIDGVTYRYEDFPTCSQISIKANGLSGPKKDGPYRTKGPIVNYDGAGGGGGGGTILLDIGAYTSVSSFTLNIEAVGGSGGDTESSEGCYAPGGGGGGGYIRFVNPTLLPNVITNVSGGIRGDMLGGQIGQPECLADREHEDGQVGQVDFGLDFPELKCSCNQPNAVTIANPDDTLCVGDALTLTGAYTDGGGTVANGGMYYVWYKAGETLSASDYTTTTGTIPNVNIASTAITDTGTWILRVQDGNDPSDATDCALADTVVIDIDLLPTTAEAGPNDVICASESSYTLAGNNPTTGTGLWTVGSDGTGTFFNDNIDTTTVRGFSAGTNIYRWTITNGVCPPSQDSVTITVDEIPTVAEAGANDGICENATSYTLDGNNPSTGTGVWTVGSDGAGSFNSAALHNTTVQSYDVGTNIYRWTITNGVCPPSQDSVVITVDALPTTAEAGDNESICATTTSYSLGGNNPTTGTGVWTVGSAGTGTFADDGVHNTSVDSYTAGTNIYRWTISSGMCPASQDSVIITVDAAPTVAEAGDNDVICESESDFTLGGNSPSVGTGLWTVGSSGAGSFDDDGDPTASVSSFSTGTNIYRWTISNGVCPPSQDSVTLSVDAAPTTAEAGPNDAICVTETSYTLQGNDPSQGTGQWTVGSAGAGTFANDDTFNSSVDGFSAGTNVYRWTISNGVCPPSQDSITLTVNAQPVVGVTKDSSICVGSSIDLVATSTPAATFTWNGGQTGATLPISPAVGQLTYTVIGEDGNGCTDTAEVVVTVNALPEPDIQGPTEICEGDTVTLSELAADIASYTWTVNSGTGTLELPTDESTVELIAGSGTDIEILLSVTDVNGCTSTDLHDLTIDALPPVADIIGEVDDTLAICLSETNLMPGNDPSPGTGLWTAAPTNTADFAAVTSPTLFNSGLNQGSLSDGDIIGAIWTISNGVCTPTDDTVYIKVTDQVEPAVSIAPGVIEVCEGTEVTVRLSGVNGGSAPLYQFFDQDDNPLSTASSVDSLEITLDGTVTGIYGVLTSNSSCLAPGSDGTAQSATLPITVESTVDPADITGYAPNELIETCASSVELDAAAVGNGTYRWYLDGIVDAVGVDQLDAGAGTNVIAAGSTVTVLLEVAGTYCPSLFDSVRINRKADLTEPVPSFTDSTVCIDISGLQIAEESAAVGDEIPSWVAVGPASINAAGVISGLVSGANEFYLKYDNGSCADSTLITVSTDDLPGAASLIGGETLIETCTDNTNLNAEAPVPGAGRWVQVSGDGVLDPLDLDNPLIEVSGLEEGETGTFRWIVSNGVCVDRDSVDVSVERKGRITDAEINLSGTGFDEDYTSNDSADICFATPGYVLSPLTLPGADEEGTWSIVSGTSLTIPEGTGNPQAITLNTLGVTEVKWRINKTGALADVCDSDSIILAIEIWDDPTVSSDASVTGCEGDLLTFTASATNYEEFFWSTSDFSLTTAESQSLSFSRNDIPVGTHALVANVSNPGCGAGNTVMAVVVDGNDVPVVTLGISDDTVCVAQEDVILTASALNAGIPVYKWSVDDVDQASVTSTAVLPTDLEPGTHRVKIEIESTSTCSTAPGASDSIVVEVIGEPTPFITSDDTTKCITVAPVILNANYTAGSTVEWFFEDISQEGGDSTEAFSTGSYYFVENNGECPSVASDIQMVVIYDEPRITIAENDLTFESQDTGTFVLTGIPGVSAQEFTSIDWTSENPLVNFATNGTEEPVIEFAEAGIYEITMNVMNGECPFTDVITISVRGAIQIPNTFTPNADGWNDDFVIRGLEGYSNTVVRVFNRWGNLVYENYGTYSPWDGTRNGKELPPATYYYIVEVGSEEVQIFSGDVTIVK